MEKSDSESLLVVEADDGLRKSIADLLSGAGYEVSTDYRDGMKSVLAFSPDAVILGAYPPQLDCCDLLSEIKGSERTQNIRVVMLSRGGPSERTRGLELGADDVLSVPFDSHELLARLRWQLRNKHAIEGFRQRTRAAEENRDVAQQVASAVSEERRTLRVGGILALTVLVAAAAGFLVFYHRTQQQNTRVYAAITRLQTGMLTQEKLMDRSRQPADNAQGDASPGTSEAIELQKQSHDLKSQIAANKNEADPALQNQLAAVQERLQRLETEGKVAETIIQSYEPSVCLIHVVVGFRDRITGLNLHYAGVTSVGEPLRDGQNNPLVSVTGSGPEVHLDVFGTGFLVSDTGQILTNHHVAEPWWNNDDLKEMTNQGVEPTAVEMTSYFPGVIHGIALTTEKISSDADVALLKGDISGFKIKEINFADDRRSAVSGGPVVLLGYPTGIDAILARTGEDTLRSIATATKGDSEQVMEELARRRLIRPVVTQGHIGDVLPDKIIYDAQTTSGGSGGPLFNAEGKVIGINFAMVRDFGGSNFAVPIAFGKSLMKP